MTARPMPRWIGRAIGVADRIALALAWISGAALLVLALFVTVDVLGRRFGGLYSGATDEISVFMMAAATTFALAYTTALGKHIRIDLVLHWFPGPLRRVVDYASVTLLAAFGALLAVNSWRLAAESWELGTVSMSKLSVPLAIPQAAMAAGFTFLAVHALLLLLASPYTDLESLHDAHRGDADRIQDL